VTILTVGETLTLPSLREAFIFAGANGLQRQVNYVTVLDTNSSPDIIRNTMAVKDALVITILALGNKTEDMLVESIKVLHGKQEAGLIAFINAQVGLNGFNLAADICNKLAFPLVFIPNTANFYFSDIIREVMEELLWLNIQNSQNLPLNKEDLFVRAVLSNDWNMIHRLRRLGFQAENKVEALLLLTLPTVETPDQQLISRICETTKVYYRNKNIATYTAYQEKVFVTIFPSNAKQPVSERLTNDLLKLLDVKCIAAQFCTLTSAEQANQAVKLWNRVCDSLAKVFPHKTVFTIYDLGLVQNCLYIIHKGGEDLGYYQRLLDVLTVKERGAGFGLQETLETFLLDADSSGIKAAGLLFIHTNTIQYRLKKISELLHTDLGQVSVHNQLSTAAAINRLLPH